MKCQICGCRPRAIDIFGGMFWKHVLTDTRICPVCAWWACKILGLRYSPDLKYFFG